MATTADLEALATRTRGHCLEALMDRMEARERPRVEAFGRRLYIELERDQGMSWVEALRALTYRPDAEMAIHCYLSYRPIPMLAPRET